MAGIMASGSASAQAERAAIGRTEAWFEQRIAPLTGTAKRVARAGPLVGGAGDPAQFDCIDTTNNTNSLLLILDQLKLLRHHTIAAPASRFLLTEGPHNTAVHTIGSRGAHRANRARHLPETPRMAFASCGSRLAANAS
jgi:hypothetical protein